MGHGAPDYGADPHLPARPVCCFVNGLEKIKSLILQPLGISDAPCLASCRFGPLFPVFGPPDVFSPPCPLRAPYVLSLYPLFTHPVFGLSLPPALLTRTRAQAKILRDTCGCVLVAVLPHDLREHDPTPAASSVRIEFKRSGCRFTPGLTTPCYLLGPSLLPELVHVHLERSEPIREASVLRIHLPRLLEDHRPRARSMDLLG